jgi:hypothetical protein
MFKDEKFKKVKDLGKGEIVVKLPGTDMKMPYSGGEAFVNKKGTIGYNSLKVYDLYTKSTGKAEGMLAGLGENLAEQLNDPDVKGLIKKMLAQEDNYLFFSKTKDGKDVITLPSMKDNSIDDETLEGLVLGGYSTAGNLPSLNKVYALHLQAIGDREVIADKAVLEKETLELTSKVNDVYKKILKLMEEVGF